MIIVVDSDGLVGSLNLNDPHYPVASKLADELIKQGSRFIYPATTIVETITLLQGRLDKPELAEFLKNLISENKFDVEPVDGNLLKQAVSLMSLEGSKHNTLFDAIVAAVAQKHHADAIFSFDKFYSKKGFKLAAELIKTI